MARSALAGATLLSVILATALPGETGFSDSSRELRRSLLALRTTATALHITAHPDDEDGPVLTYLARGLGVSTSLLTINRGEGGADLIAPFFGTALGVLRTLEAEEAVRHYGASQFFTRAADYGYSKRPEEALRKWKEEDLLKDAVRVVREQRPDVVFSRFRGDPLEGHATTYVVERIARLAFEQAGDPSRFPEQIREGLLPWQPKKLYLHAARPDGAPRLPHLATVTVPAGDFDAVLGESYAQLARRGYQMYRTQGAFVRQTLPGAFDVGYQLIGRNGSGELPARERTFFDGIDTRVQGLAAYVTTGGAPTWLIDGLKSIDRNIAGAITDLDLLRPEATVPSLLRGLIATRSLIARLDSTGTVFEKRARRIIRDQLERKERQFQEAISLALSLDFRALVLPEKPSTALLAPFFSPPTLNHATPGATFNVSLRLVNRSDMPVRALSSALAAPADWTPSVLKPLPVVVLGRNQDAAALWAVAVSPSASPTTINWSRESEEQTAYQIRDETHATRAVPENPLSAVVEVEVSGVRLAMRTTVLVTRPEPLLPPTHPPLTVVPAISVRFASENGVMRDGALSYRVEVIVHGSVNGEATGSVSLGLPPRWTSSPVSAPFTFEREDDERTIEFLVSTPEGLKEGDRELTATARYQGRDYSEGYQTITAPDLGRLNLYQPARHRVRTLALNVPPGLRVGYVMGARDAIPQALAQAGIDVELLGSAQLAASDLSAFDAIVVGIRAYAVRPDVKAFNRRLLDYTFRGGVLMVQYQTPEFDDNYGPYPYSMTASPEEVSEEDAGVQILDAGHPVFRAPNPITPSDFDAWVGERGSKFLSAWDPRYVPLLETHDERQSPQRGGLLIAEYGKGTYVYNAYAFHRQLPRGVEGAFRLYVNLLSLGKTRVRR